MAKHVLETQPTDMQKYDSLPITAMPRNKSSGFKKKKKQLAARSQELQLHIL